MTLQEAIEEVKLDAIENGEWTKGDVLELQDLSCLGAAIATILNAVVKGELRHDER